MQKMDRAETTGLHVLLFSLNKLKKNVKPLREVMSVTLNERGKRRRRVPKVFSPPLPVLPRWDAASPR